MKKLAVVRNVAVVGAMVAMAITVMHAQQDKPMSPRGQAAAQVGGAWDTSGQFPVYRNGQWIEIDYGRPILRGREDLFGSGDDYGTALLAGAPIWRAGANVSTRLSTEAPLMIGDTRVEPGEYSLFIELGEDAWTLVVSSHAAKPTFQAEEGIWGAYGYEQAKDVARAPMTLVSGPFQVEQLTWGFADVSDEGGKLVIAWDDQRASVEFKLAS